MSRVYINECLFSSVIYFDRPGCAYIWYNVLSYYDIQTMKINKKLRQPKMSNNNFSLSEREENAVAIFMLFLMVSYAGCCGGKLFGFLHGHDGPSPENPRPMDADDLQTRNANLVCTSEDDPATNLFCACFFFCSLLLC
jgi:hypothetical protein